KFANKTVNHNQSVTRPVKTLSEALADGRFQKNKSVVSRLPISTMNITGFFIIWRGSSLAKESTIARRMIAGSNNALVAAWRRRTFGGRDSTVSAGSVARSVMRST